MRGCGCCRMSKWDSRLDLDFVFGVVGDLCSKDGGRGESLQIDKGLTDRIPLN